MLQRKIPRFKIEGHKRESGMKESNHKCGTDEMHARMELFVKRMEPARIHKTENWIRQKRHTRESDFFSIPNQVIIIHEKA